VGLFAVNLAEMTRQASLVAEAAVVAGAMLASKGSAVRSLMFALHLLARGFHNHTNGRSIPKG
jgi:hypothetical protein